jgi:hypothetical protein
VIHLAPCHDTWQGVVMSTHYARGQHEVTVGRTTARDLTACTVDPVVTLRVFTVDGADLLLSFTPEAARELGVDLIANAQGDT